MRAKYKVGQIVEFEFAGGIVRGEIKQVIRGTKDIRYKITDGKTLYPATQDGIVKKIE